MSITPRLSFIGALGVALTLTTSGRAQSASPAIRGSLSGGGVVHLMEVRAAEEWRLAARFRELRDHAAEPTAGPRERAALVDFRRAELRPHLFELKGVEVFWRVDSLTGSGLSPRLLRQRLSNGLRIPIPSPR